MNLVEQLQKLEQLHKNASLTDEEFSKAKTLLLSSSQGSSADLPYIQGFVDKETQLKRLDFEWKTERQKFQTKQQATMRPIMPWAVGLGIAGGITAWILVNGSLEQEEPILGQPQNVDLLKSGQSGFEILTILLLIVTIWICIRHSKRINENGFAYRTALKNYQEERDQILNS